MKLKKIFYHSIFILLFVGCDTNDDQMTLEETSIGFEVIEEGNLEYSRFDPIPEQYLVFHDQSEWDSFLTYVERLEIDKYEHFQNLSFDFEENSLIIITAEFEELCCRSISIEKVYKRKDTQIYVDFIIEGAADRQVEMQPFKLIKISK